MASEKEKADKTKINSQIKHVPKDAQVIQSILKELNIVDYEPRVINQLLEFTYRYVTCILDDAKVFANHARKKIIDLEDVRLATEVMEDKAFTTPPARLMLSKMAETRNNMPLPPIKPHCGLRLPPDRYCLSACNYKLRATHSPKKMTKSALDGRSSIKSQVKSTGGSTSTNTGNGKRPNSLNPKSQQVTVPKPVIKFSSTSKAMPLEKKGNVAGVESNDVKMEIDVDASAVGSIAGGGGIKREREEEEFEMV